MSKLDEAGLPQAPKGMFWYLSEDINGDIRLSLMATYEESETRRYGGGEHKIIKSVWVVESDQRRLQEITAGLLKDRAQEILKWWGTMEANRSWLGVTGRNETV